jgi:hypothetical protein
MEFQVLRRLIMHMYVFGSIQVLLFFNENKLDTLKEKKLFLRKGMYATWSICVLTFA